MCCTHLLRQVAKDHAVRPSLHDELCIAAMSTLPGCNHLHHGHISALIAAGVDVQLGGTQPDATADAVCSAGRPADGAGLQRLEAVAFCPFCLPQVRFCILSHMSPVQFWRLNLAFTLRGSGSVLVCDEMQSPAAVLKPVVIRLRLYLRL